MKIYFATDWLTDTMSVSLNKINISLRLLSFYFVREYPRSYLRRYVRYGKIKKGEVNENK